ncbi:MAG: sulfur carrier protein ThiS [Planctomycetota bacterium]
MKLTVNGETKDVAATRLDELLGELGLTGQAVAVELNRQVVPKSAHADTPLAEGDAVELVTLVGGG